MQTKFRVIRDKKCNHCNTFNHTSEKFSVLHLYDNITTQGKRIINN